ncbi:MAG: hypothetical protein R3C44_19025 [Chloroflexota bacterium]
MAIADGDTILLLDFWPTFRDVAADELNFEQRRAQTAADSLFETIMATLAFLPGPGDESAGGTELPSACMVDGMGLYLDTEAGLCVAIPAGFTAQRTPLGQPRLIGPALDESLSPARVTLAMEPPEEADGRSLEQAVADRLDALGSAANDVVQSEITLGGESAVLLEGITTGRGSHEIVAIHNGMVYRFVLQPDPEQIETALDDMSLLMETVRNSFSFLVGESE